MSLDSTQLQALQTELQRAQYDSFLTPAGNEDWNALVAFLNSRENTGLIVQETHLDANSLRVEVRASEYPTGNSASDQTARGLLALLLQGVTERLDVSPGSNLRDALGDIFPAGSLTRTAWLALLDREGSIIEDLFSVNLTVTRTEVQKAVRGQF